MATAEWSHSVSPSSRDVVSTDVDLASSITGDRAREKWQLLIDQLLKWCYDPSQLDDEGVESPNRETIVTAIRLLLALKNDKVTPPDSVVPDPNGGIVIERREMDVCEVFHVWDDGTLEYRRFQGARLIERQAL